MFREIRRKDRILDNELAIRLLEEAEYGFLAMSPEEERRYALRLLVNKYSSAFKEIGEKYIEKSFYRTNILRLDISHISGKCKRLSQLV